MQTTLFEDQNLKVLLNDHSGKKKKAEVNYTGKTHRDELPVFKMWVKVLKRAEGKLNNVNGIQATN